MITNTKHRQLNLHRKRNTPFIKKKMNFLKKQVLFSLPAVGSQQKQRLMFIAIKTEDSEIKGKISFYCRIFKVSRQAFNNYLILTISTQQSRSFRCGSLSHLLFPLTFLKSSKYKIFSHHQWSFYQHSICCKEL